MAVIHSIKTYGVEIECYIKINSSLSATSTLEEVAEAITEAGIECRNENYNHETRTWWKIVNDGSLREKCPSGYIPAELVSPVLTDEINGYEQIKKVCEVIAQFDAKVLSSCGLHVHVGYHKAASNRTLPTKALLKFYAQNEKWFDAMMPESRRMNENRFCQTMKQGMNSLLNDENDSYRVARYQSSIAKMFKQYYWNDRYHKVNLLSYVKYGTVEFRQHSGTTESKKIISWVKVCRGLCEKSRKEVANQNYQQAESFKDFLNQVKDYVSVEAIAYLKSRYNHFNPSQTQTARVDDNDGLPF